MSQTVRVLSTALGLEKPSCASQLQGLSYFHPHTDQAICSLLIPLLNDRKDLRIPTAELLDPLPLLPNPSGPTSPSCHPNLYFHQIPYSTPGMFRQLKASHMNTDWVWWIAAHTLSDKAFPLTLKATFLKKTLSICFTLTMVKMVKDSLEISNIPSAQTFFRTAEKSSILILLWYYSTTINSQHMARFC